MHRTSTTSCTIIVTASAQGSVSLGISAGFAVADLAAAVDASGVQRDAAHIGDEQRRQEGDHRNGRGADDGDEVVERRVVPNPAIEPLRPEDDAELDDPAEEEDEDRDDEREFGERLAARAAASGDHEPS